MKAYDYARQLYSINTNKGARKPLKVMKTAFEEYFKGIFNGRCGKILREHLRNRMGTIEKHFYRFYLSLRGTYVKHGYAELSDSMALLSAIDSLLDIPKRFNESGQIDDRFVPKATYWDDAERKRTTRTIQELAERIDYGVSGITDDEDCQRGVDVLWRFIKEIALEDTTTHKQIERMI